MIMKRVLRILAITLIMALGLIGQRYYAYVTNTQSPYDEVGIEINRYMPQPVRKWGCDKLHATFGNTLPPYGCQAEGGNGQKWL